MHRDKKGNTINYSMSRGRSYWQYWSKTIIMSITPSLRHWLWIWSPRKKDIGNGSIWNYKIWLWQ
jgi:hypothetical protein